VRFATRSACAGCQPGAVVVRAVDAPAGHAAI